MSRKVLPAWWDVNASIAVNLGQQPTNTQEIVLAIIEGMNPQAEGAFLRHYHSASRAYAIERKEISDMKFAVRVEMLDSEMSFEVFHTQDGRFSARYENGTFTVYCLTGDESVKVVNWDGIHIFG